LEAIGNPGGRPADDSKTPMGSDLPSHDQREHRPSLYLLLLFLALTAGIVATGYLFYRGYARNFRSEVEHELSSISELKVGQLVQWRKERMGDASVFYKNKVFSGLVRRFLEKPEDAEARGLILNLLGRVQDAYQYERVVILDAHGIERLAVPGTPEPVASHLLQQIPEILRSNKITFLDFHRATPDCPIHLSLVVPVREESDGGRPLGVLVLRIDPATYLYPFIQQWPTPSLTAETLLVRRDGNDALFLNELKFQKDTALKLRVPLTSMDIPSVKAALGQEGIVEGIDYRGVRVIADVRGVPDSPWFLIARMDSAEAFAPVRARLWLMVGLVAVLLFGAGAGAGLIWRQQRLRFFQARLAAAETLETSENKFRNLFNNALEGVYQTTPEGRLITANMAFARMFGYESPGEAVKTVTDIARQLYVDPDERKRAVSILRETGFLKDFEFQMRKKDGSVIWVSTNARLNKSPDGNPSFEGFITDITRRKRAEEMLQKALAQAHEGKRILDTLMEQVPEGITIADAPDVRIRMVSRYGRELTGKSKEILEGITVDKHTQQWDIYCADGVTPAKNEDLPLTRATLKGELVKDEEWVLGRQSGKRIPILCNAGPIRDDVGNIIGGVIAWRDITERKRAEEALRESEDRFRTLYENSTIGLYRTTPDGRIHLANPALIRMLGYSSFDDLSNRNLEKNGFEPSYPRTQFVEIIEKDGEVKGLESSWKRKDGTIIFVRESARAIRDSQAKTLYYDGTVEDITERKRAEEALCESERLLREDERALRERNDELIRFNYAVSHDLKSPLVTIQTFLGYLEQDVRKPDAAGVDKDLEYIRTASDKMSRLLNELLELSRVGRKMNPPVEAPLQAIVREALDLVAGRIAERGVKVKVTKKPILLCGDRPRLVEIFQNLVDNAVKFMGDEPAPLVEIGAEQADDEIVLFVRDNGIGIDQRHQSKLFGLFEKLDPGSEGTGIGLALVKRIVEVHGGKIWVESEGPGQGATFRFTLAKTRRLSR
jgi:PAS domain S-box-containing protein